MLGRAGPGYSGARRHHWPPTLCALQDFAGGHIAGAVNAPSEFFREELDALIAEQVQGKHKVVVHCMLSQQRGPRCATLLADRLHQLGLPQSVLVMRGGFRTFSAMYKDDASLVSVDR